MAAIITTGAGYFNINGVVYPVNSGTVTKTDTGIKFTYNSGQYVNQQTINIPFAGTTFNGATVANADALLALANSNFFRSGGADGIQGSGSLPLNSRVIGFGDSITGFWSSTLTNRENFQNRGYMLFANMKANNRYYKPIGGNQGVPGNTTAQMLARLDTALALNAKVMCGMGGTNDIIVSGISSDTTINNLNIIFDAFTAAGTTVIWGTITPRFTPNALTPEQEAKRQAVNTWIKTKASAVFHVLDFDSLMNDASLYVDGLHPTSIGAKLQGDKYGEILAKLIRGGNVIGDFRGTNAYNANLYFTGTNGTLSNGATGVVAASYELDRGTTGATVVGSIRNDSGILSQQIAVSGNYTGTNPYILLKENTTVSPPAAGDVIEGMAEVTIAVNHPNVVGINLNFNVYNASFQSLARGDAYLPLDQLSNQFEPNSKFVIRTPSVAVASTTAATRVALEMSIVLKDQTVSTPIATTIIVHRIGARKVPATY